MKSGNISQLTEQLDSMVEALGLEKLSVEGPVGESAGVIADPGTANPAEQEAARSNIEPATEGSQSASNNQISISGKATTYTAVSNFYSNLTGSGYFRDVSLGRTFEVPEGVSFSLTCGFAGEEQAGGDSQG